ncbi:MAG: hypothetical protein AMXMBFR66_26400 [Pseudomonadota bacterium]
MRRAHGARGAPAAGAGMTIGTVSGRIAGQWVAALVSGTCRFWPRCDPGPVRAPARAEALLEWAAERRRPCGIRLGSE